MIIFLGNKKLIMGVKYCEMVNEMEIKLQLLEVLKKNLDGF